MSVFIHVCMYVYMSNIGPNKRMERLLQNFREYYIGKRQVLGYFVIKITHVV